MEDDEVKKILDSYLNAQEFWEDQFDLEIVDHHKCGKIPEDNSSKIMKANCVEMNVSTWYFFNARLATFYDVEPGEAERVADIQSSSMVAIEFCPFCGRELI